jgi:hypothetical protein
MTSYKHTPGPWWVDPTYLGDIQAEGTEIASAFEAAQKGAEWIIQGPITPSREEQRANARLMAAAPDLLEALQEAVGFVPMGNPKWTDRALAAINKALGEAE